MITGLRGFLLYSAFAVGGLVLAPVPALACSIVAPPVEETIQRTAQHGVVMRGTVIQAFDAEKGHAETIRADVIYIGDDRPREFVIYAPLSDFRLSEERPIIQTSCDWATASHPVGHVYDLVVLEPAGNRDSAGNGRWVFSLFGSQVAYGEGLELLVDKAERIGRLQSRPEVSDN